MMTWLSYIFVMLVALRVSPFDYIQKTKLGWLEELHVPTYAVQVALQN